MSLHKDANPATGGSEETLEHVVFKGLTPRIAEFDPSCESAPGGFRKGLFGSIPLIMTGTLATGMIAAPPITVDASGGAEAEGGNYSLDSRPGFATRLQNSFLPVAQVVLDALRPDLPATYQVEQGDSVSSIADRFGMPTPAILTLNGLGWDTVLHEGQVIKLTAEATKKKASSPARVAGDGYLVQNGESASAIADRMGISTDALLRHNDLEDDAVIYAGQLILLPGVSAPVVQRDIQGSTPVIASGPTIIAASLSSDEITENSEEESAEPVEDVFDAADIALAEKPALVTVRVPTKKVAPVVKAVEKVVEAKQVQSAPSVPASSSSDAEDASEEEAEASSGVGQPISGSITPLNDERRGNAELIISVGKELGVSDYGIVIALATAMQESSLRNLDWGDRDSLGLFQQRPSSGWGSGEQIMDRAYATRVFFGGPSNPNAGKTKGLLDISGWESMALTVAAQKVQISGHPTAYAKWEASAWSWLYELT
ncbi:MAG: LysM peptidoglycan-binding domain-containing protein [Microbacteriaceae bacterium]